MSDSNSRLVYSTETGRIDEPKAAPVRPKGDGVVRIQRQTSGRKGKGVCLITGVDLDDVIRVLLADDADLPHEGVHRLYHLLGHSVHDTGEHCCPAQSQQYDQEQTHEEITVIRGRVDEGVSQHRAVFQRAAAAQIAVPVHPHILCCIGGQILVGVFLGEEEGT